MKCGGCWCSCLLRLVINVVLCVNWCLMIFVVFCVFLNIRVFLGWGIGNFGVMILGMLK